MSIQQPQLDPKTLEALIRLSETENKTSNTFEKPYRVTQWSINTFEKSTNELRDTVNSINRMVEQHNKEKEKIESNEDKKGLKKIENDVGKIEKGLSFWT